MGIHGRGPRIPVDAFHDLGGLWLPMFSVGESIDVRGKTRRRRGIDSGDVVVDSDLVDD